MLGSLLCICSMERDHRRWLSDAGSARVLFWDNIITLRKWCWWMCLSGNATTVIVRDLRPCYPMRQTNHRSCSQLQQQLFLQTGSDVIRTRWSFYASLSLSYSVFWIFHSAMTSVSASSQLKAFAGIVDVEIFDPWQEFVTCSGLVVSQKNAWSGRCFILGWWHKLLLL